MSGGHTRATTLTLLLLLPALAGCLATGPADGPTEAGTPTPSDEPAVVEVPPLRPGDRALYQDLHTDDRVRVEVLDPRPVLAANGSLVQALLVEIEDQADGAPHVVQAIDPATGRLLRTVDHCPRTTAEEGCPPWPRVRFETWDVPGLFTAALLAGRTLTNATTLEVTVNTSQGPVPLATDVRVQMGHRPNGTPQRFAVVETTLDGAPAPGDPAAQGLFTGTIALTNETPFPAKVQVSDPTDVAFPTFLLLRGFDRGDGPETRPSGASLGPPTPLLEGTDPLRRGLPFTGSIEGDVIAPAEALQLALDDERLQRYLDEHPAAVLARGEVSRPTPDLGPTGRDVTQSVTLTWATPGNDTAHRVRVERVHEYRDGHRIDNETRIAHSGTDEPPNGFHQAATPDRVHPLNALLSRTADTGLDVDGLAWKHTHGRSPLHPPPRLLGALLLEEHRADHVRPALVVDLATGALWGLTGPQDLIDQLDHQGLSTGGGGT